jgi:arsenate reductase
MKKIYHLSTCSTCKRIIAELNDGKGFELQDIKTVLITEKQLDEMKKMSGNYESLFSRNALKYRSMGLHEKELSEQDYKRLILEEYTFLKRPVIINEDKIFIGNAAKTIAEAKKYI